MAKTKTKKTITAQGREWTPEQLKSYRNYQRDFIKENYTNILLHFSKTKDADVISWLRQQENITGYIKQLIKEDIGKSKKDQ